MIVQHIRAFHSFYDLRGERVANPPFPQLDKKGNMVKVPLDGGDLDYFEAWEVPPKSMVATPVFPAIRSDGALFAKHNDVFAVYKDEYPRGDILVIAQAYYIDGATLKQLRNAGFKQDFTRPGPGQLYQYRPDKKSAAQANKEDPTWAKKFLQAKLISLVDQGRVSSVERVVCVSWGPELGEGALITWSTPNSSSLGVILDHMRRLHAYGNQQKK